MPHYRNLWSGISMILTAIAQILASYIVSDHGFESLTHVLAVIGAVGGFVTALVAFSEAPEQARRKQPKYRALLFGPGMIAISAAIIYSSGTTMPVRPLFYAILLADLGVVLFWLVVCQIVSAKLAFSTRT